MALEGDIDLTDNLDFYRERKEIIPQLPWEALKDSDDTIINEYLRRGKLKVELLGRGMAWLDTGTHKGLLDASNYVEAVQTRQGLYIACLEEIAYRKGHISKGKLLGG